MVGNGNFNADVEFGTPGEPTDATLNVQNLATFEVVNPDGDASIAVGNSANAVGTVTVDNASLKIDGSESSDIVVGDSGTGNLTLQNNASLDSLFVTLGRIASGDGTAMLTGGSLMRLHGADSSNQGAFLTVGASGIGDFTVTGGSDLEIEGGLADFPGLQIGRNEGGSGTMTVAGGSSVFINSDHDDSSGAILWVGRMGEGSLTITEGSDFINDDSGFTAIGQTETGSGTVTVLDDSLFLAGELLLVGRGYDFGTDGPLDVANGGSGLLSIGQDAIVAAEEILTGRGGTIEGTGTLIGGLVHEGGTVSAGDSIGTLFVDGFFEVLGGTIFTEIDKAEAQQADLIEVSEDAFITKGAFVFDLLNGTQPVAGDVFDFIDTGALAELAEGFSPDDISFGIYNIGAALTFDAFGTNLGTPVNADVEVFIRDGFSTAVRFNTTPTIGNDALFLGGTIDDSFEGRDGDDLLMGGAGDDDLAGGAGDDSLLGEEGDDSLDGGAGNDSAAGGAGDDHYINTTGGGFDEVDLSSNAAGDFETAFVGEGIFDVNWGRDGNDLLIQAAVNSDYDINEDNHIRFVDHYLAGTVGLVFFEGDIGADNAFYTDPGNAEGVEIARIFTPQGVNGTDQGGFTEVIQGTAANETLNGNGGFRDFIFGFGGDDRLIGTNVTEDFMRGGAGNDDLIGLSGNDFLRGGIGNDSLFGGDGFDEADYRRAIDAGGDGIGVTVDLNQQGVSQAVGDGMGSDHLEDIEALRGTSRADTLIGDGGDNRLRGEDGNDSLIGNAGDDDIRGDAGDDVMSGDEGDDRLDGGSGNDSISGGDGDDVLIGRFGNDSLSGGLGTDQLFPGVGTDTVVGGNDGGFDRVDYSPAEIDSINYTGSGVQGAGSVDEIIGGGVNATDTISEIEWIVGTEGDDNFTAGVGNGQRFDPQGGTDSIAGNSGFDQLGYEFDEGPLKGITLILTGDGEGTAVDRDGNTDSFSGIDLFIGSGGDDLFIGTGAFDNFLATAGNDEYIGNGGGDFLDFFNVDSAVTANLTEGAASYFVDGEEFDDSLDGIGGLLGSSFNDSLTGDDGDNLLRGGGGSDQLFGAEGADTFEYGSPEDGQAVATNVAVVGAGGDTIADFDVNGNDVIRLSAAEFSGLDGGDLIDLGATVYDGTNSGQANGAALIHDGNDNLIYDEDVQTEGYTILANTNGATVDTDDVESF